MPVRSPSGCTSVAIKTTIVLKKELTASSQPRFSLMPLPCPLCAPSPEGPVRAGRLSVKTPPGCPPEGPMGASRWRKLRCLCDVYAQASPLRSEERPPSRQYTTPRRSLDLLCVSGEGRRTNSPPRISKLKLPQNNTPKTRKRVTRPGCSPCPASAASRVACRWPR
jgi:hypothetical protein